MIRIKPTSTLFPYTTLFRSWGRLSDDGPGQHNPDRSEGPWGKAEDRLHGSAHKHIVPDTGQGMNGESREHEGEKRPMPRSGRSSSAGSRPGSSGKSRRFVLAASTPAN